MREVPVSADEFSGLFRALRNWSRRGADDERGALHLLTPARIAAATRLVRDGVSVSLSLPLNTTPAIHNPKPADHYMTALAEHGAASEPVHFTKDYVGLELHQGLRRARLSQRRPYPHRRAVPRRLPGRALQRPGRGRGDGGRSGR